MLYKVKIKITGDYEVDVEAKNEAEARNMAYYTFCDEDFGALKNPQGPITEVIPLQTVPWKN